MVRFVPLTVLVCLLLTAVGHAQEPLPKAPAKRVGVVLDMAAARGRTLLEASKKELVAFMGEGNVSFPGAKTLVGDGTGTTARRNLAKLLADPEVDLVWAFGAVASNEAAKLETVDKPLLAPFVLDEKVQGIQRGKTPDKLAYILWTPNFARDLKTLQTFGEFKHIAYLGGKHVHAEVPGLTTLATKEAKTLGLDLTWVPVGTSAEGVLKAIPTDADAVYLGPNMQLSLEQIDKLAAGFILRKLPSFSWVGKIEVDRGILAGLAGPEDLRRMTRLIALDSDALLRGDLGFTLSTTFKMDERLAINSATARAIGLSLGWEVTSEATLLNAKKTPVKRTLTLAKVVSEVLDANLDLRANNQNIPVAENAVDEARAALLPRVDASLSGAWIDPDGGNPINPERSLTWSASLSQTIFNEASWSAFSVQQYLRDATKHGNRSAQLDATQAATVSYINVLLTKTAENVRRDNLRTTRELLALARVRERLGTGKRSEVVRLESTLASTRSDVVAAVADRNIAEIELNRLLNRPLEETFAVDDVSLESSGLMRGGKRFAFYMGDKKRFKAMRAFIAKEAVANSPELKALDSQIAAKDRDETSKARAPFMPIVSANAGVSHRFLRGGAGTEPQAAALFPANNFNWQFGITATLPIYSGNVRYARRKRVSAELRQLKVQRKSNAQVIATTVRKTLHRAGASWRAIRLTQDAARSAQENLELVSVSYGQGKANIVEVLDAQNQAVVARFSANSAVYVFLVDLMNLQRGMGKFEFTMSKDDIASFFSRLSRYSRKFNRRATK